jgi:hypothetical protein
VSAPAPQQAVLRQAERLGRRHGKAWQIGDSGSDAALAFCGILLNGVADGDPQLTGLFEMPGLGGRHDYDRDSLAADLGLAPDAPVLAQATQAYLAAAREEFWQEATRLARRLQAAGPRTSDESGKARQDITDPATGLSRDIATELCHHAAQARQAVPAPDQNQRRGQAGELAGQNAALRRERDNLTSQFEAALSHLRRLTIDNAELRRELQTARAVTRIGRPDTASHG